MICVGEMVAKIACMLVTVNNTLEQAQTEKVSKIESITSKMETELEQSDRLLEKMIPSR
jgi:hypothetical protein